jgi:CRP-like cAMP-binding protein
VGRLGAVALDGPADGGVGGWPPGSFLGRLSPSLRGEFLELGVRRTFQPGEPILMEGEHSTHAVLLLEGRVKVTARTADGGYALLAFRGAGDTVGELAATDGEPRVATVSAVGGVDARVISSEEFNGYLSRSPDASRVAREAVSRRLRSATQRRIDFAGCDVKVRIARVLVTLSRDYGTQTPAGPSVALTQPELGQMATAREAAVQKALGDLRSQGIISTGYRSITICDEIRLWRVAYPDEKIPY